MNAVLSGPATVPRMAIVWLPVPSAKFGVATYIQVFGIGAIGTGAASTVVPSMSTAKLCWPP